LDDARSVQIDGVLERRVFVDYDPARLAALGVSTGYLIGQLQNQNLVAGSGDVASGTRTLALRTDGVFNSVEDVRQTALRLPAGEVVALQDLAEVREGYAEPGRQRVRVNGEAAVTVGVSMKASGKLTEFGPEVLDAVEATKTELPAGIGFDVVVYQPRVVDSLTSEFVWSLVQAVFIVIGVLLLSLGVRTGLVVAASIPITMFASFIAMHALGITINQMSLTALIVALGLLVDNSIVVAEQVLTDVEGGKDKREAAQDAAGDLAFPLFVASASTAAALLPTYLAPGASSEYVAALFEVLAISLAVSWLLSMTLIPLLCVLFLKVDHEATHDRTPIWRRLAERAGWVSAKTQTRVPADDPAAPFETPFYRRYRGVLLGMVRRPWLSLGAFVAVLVVANVLFATAVPQQFFPEKSYSVFNVELTLPWGTSLDETDRVVADLERYMADSLMAPVSEPAERMGEPPEVAEPGVIKWAAYVGSPPPRYTLAFAPEAPNLNYAYLLVTASSPDAHQRLFERVGAYMARAHPEVTTRPNRLQNGPPITYPVEIRISGDDPARLQGVAGDVRDRLREVPGLENVGTDWGPRQAALDVEVDHRAARRAGLATSDVTLSLQTALDGVPLTALQQGDQLVPVVLRSTDALAGAEALDRLELYSEQARQSVPFGQVAQARVVYEPGNIERYDGRRTVTVQADIAPTAGPFVTPFSVQADLQDYLDEASASWPAGVSYAYGGTVEESAESQGAINSRGPLAGIVIVLLLVIMFNALRPPLVVLLTLPFAFVGTVLGMLVSGYAFGFMPLLGTIALVGIILNNAVVLLDRVGSEERRGLPPEQALLHAAQQRFRPILLTAATTAGGLIPLWIAGSPLFAPMAVALLFGLVVSSALTPGLVPVLHTLVYRLDFSGVDYDPDPELRPQTDAVVEEETVGEGYDEAGVPVGNVPEVGHAPKADRPHDGQGGEGSDTGGVSGGDGVPESVPRPPA
ncbi:efflux RND transporter permease subunit, partial [Rubrivirga sp.]|uniref:efflux RND transporter permease subunit n=1 Tax=Rubrivirga sp. TaxID=1885344 RepID=UPI003C7417AF